MNRTQDHIAPAAAHAIACAAPTPHQPLQAWPEGRFRHGFLGRLGGVSTGVFESLNFSYQVGDEDSSVAENWRRMQTGFPPPTRFVQVRQVHGRLVHRISLANHMDRPAGDGMVTAEPNLALCILTADCVPVLMRDRQAGVIAALHAGWRGVLSNIVAAGITAMLEIGAAPERLEAALGPAIDPCCFEVDEALAGRFDTELPGGARHRRAGRAGKAMLDLRSLLADQLCATGVVADKITRVGPCTRCESKHFFSRRAAGGVTSGLQMSFIAMSERP